METIGIREARRLALARAGLLKPAWTGFPRSGRGSGARALGAALEVMRRFGYLQLDTVSIAGARSHALVLLSRLEGFDPALGEELLRPERPLFEYWGHEACWIPLELYPAFEFRRRAFRRHPWWGDLIGEHPEVVRNLRRRIRDEGPIRAIEMEGRGSRGWWDLKVARKVAAALWSSGELAIRERRGFQRTYDLAKRVIPAEVRDRPLPAEEGIEALVLAALRGHGWATTSTVVATWRLRRMRAEVERTLRRLGGSGRVRACTLAFPEKAAARSQPGWILSEDLDLVARLESVRPRTDRGVLLSPFDPLLWDRGRVRALFGFDQVLEVFKPAANRVYGYYCLPVLAGERLVARADLKAERSRGLLRVLSLRFEGGDPSRPASSADGEAVRTALVHYAGALGLALDGLRPIAR